ncbi:ferritin-like domain-containing protein [Pareuzebyella sediminis]|uniref:ferritin-like domain-containing protein n=1 Tax=Pareuzebyella sediminis TaxID=2607998 RepID=UPI0011EF1CB8|nr:PA2169 family four-helix-bundle protein [Pareuzebyella sediminis]
MNEDVKRIQKRLQEVIEKNEDAIKGFQKAAENAEDQGIERYFTGRIEKRKQFLVQLKNAAVELDLGDSDIDGSTKGSMHRTWMDIKAFFSGDDDEAMLEEAIRGDKAAIEEYNEVLGDTHVPARLKEILREQRDAIRNDLETSNVLEDFR